MACDKAKTNVWKIYGYLFFHNLIFAYVIERLFALERGLTIQKMVFLEVLYMAVVIVLEVPTGALADKWDRRKVMILSAVFTFFEFFILIFAYHFWVFALSTLAAAIAGALASGTLNSILYDSLKKHGREHSFETILARINIVDFVSAALAALLGGYMAARNGYTFNYWMSSISVIGAILFTIGFTNPEIASSGNRTTVSYWAHMREAWMILKNSHSVLFVIGYGVIIGAVVNYFWEYYQVYNKEAGIPVIYFGIVSTCFGFLYNASGYIAVKLQKKLPLKWMFSVIISVTALCFMLSGHLRSPAGIIPFILAFSVIGAVQPLVTGYLHHRIDSAHRATIESFQSLVLRGGSMVIGLAFGYVSSRYSIFSGFTFLGAVSFAYGIYYLMSQGRFIQEPLVHTA